MNRRAFLGASTLAVATASLAAVPLAGTARAAPAGPAPGRPAPATRPLTRRGTAELLERIQRAHGGRRWRDARVVTADVTYGGPFWALKGVPDVVGTDRVVADVHRQHIRLTRPSGHVIEFDKRADLVTVTDPHGAVQRLKHPRASFDGFTATSPWTTAQAGYFRAYATWLYLIEAYVFTYPGVEITEIEPWNENGETWRVLRVTFPRTVDAHSTTQLYYFDAQGFMVRQDYEPEVSGSLPIAHYQPGRTDRHGAVITTDHEVYSRNPDRTPNRSLLRISVGVSDISLH
ncbi:hypothetical protein [Streptomyces liangshanensis]|uniref:Tat pathway signal sequence domain protein n=1 Tax=Streptomyces liangshanensis TaxID=2717324 RepID=A0A6G9H0Y8_9ACTN|nr:hypothetical protein [Streptomyces liangshanensis]QIQ04144.1 hypothetical protein HA039_19165 [Streptomyces liangshanensis]